MSRDLTARCNSSLLYSAEENSGYTLEVAAAKIKDSPERLEAWEKGDSRPTIAQLRKLAKLYKRSLALFYSPEKPKGFKPMKDFRRLPEGEELKWPPELRTLVDRVRQQQEVYDDLLHELGETRPKLAPLKSRDPEEVGSKMRSLLGLTALMTSMEKGISRSSRFGHSRRRRRNTGIAFWALRQRTSKGNEGVFRDLTRTCHCFERKGFTEGSDFHTAS